MCSMQQDVKFTEVWHMWFFLALWLNIPDIHIHTKIHSPLRPIDWHTHEHILTPSTICSHQLFVLNWIIYWYKNFLSNMAGCFWILVFDSAKEASNDVTTFLKLRFINKQKLALFTCWYYMLMSSKARSFHRMYLTFCRK